MVDIADTTVELINIYAFLRIKGHLFLKNHQPHDNSIISRDFNCHHNLWNTELAADTRIY